MTSSTTVKRPSGQARHAGEPLAAYVVVTEEALAVTLKDGRSLSVPLAWYPRLVHGSPSERNHWELIGGGSGIHWPDLDEDISVEGLIAGRRSGESPKSFKRFLEQRARGERPTLEGWGAEPRQPRPKKSGGHRPGPQLAR